MKTKFYFNFCLALLFCFNSSAQNTAIQITNDNQYLNLDHKDHYNIGDEMTIEAWIYANSWTSESWRGSLVNKDTPNPDNGYAFRCGDNGKLSFVMSANNIWNEVISPSIMNTLSLIHI